MATRYASLGRCAELPERDVIAALVSREECASLVDRIATMEPPRAVRALLALVRRMATPACTWLEGDLVVELFEDERGTTARILSDQVGLRERILPAVVLGVSLADIAATIDKRREVGAVFRVEPVSARCLLLLSWEEEEAASTGFDISETSLSMTWSPTVDDVDAGWDEPS
ncbi:MAG: hypothetical protein KF819_00785 [Labilithrix sp.]|nr:hypothetical protein [Labilithrix sp.]